MLIRRREIISLHISPTGKCGLFFSLDFFFSFSSSKSGHFQKDILWWTEHYVLQNQKIKKCKAIQEKVDVEEGETFAH